MKRLTETAMFRQLSMPGAFNPDETVLKTMYDDFAHAVVDICTTVEDDNIPAYFTLHYTRLELEQLSLVATAKGTGKNAAIDIYLHKCGKIIDQALSWISPNSGSPSFSDNDYLFVRQEFGFKKVATNTITHLQASRSYCEIHLTDAPKVVLSVPMSEVGKHLSHTNFIRIHRSFIINIRHVDALMGNMVVMKNGCQLTISKEYRSILLGYFCFVGSKSQKFTV